MTNRILTVLLSGLISGIATPSADIPGSKDPAGMKRYEGSEIIGYRGPKFDEFLLPLGPPTDVTTPKFAKSLKIEGLVSFYTYLAPAGRTGTELFRNYQQEFQKDLVSSPFMKRQPAIEDGSDLDSPSPQRTATLETFWRITKARNAF